MITCLHIPSPPLNRFIAHFYYYAGFTPGHAVDRFLPDGEVQVIFDLTDYPKYIYDNDSLKEIQSCRNVWFSGFRTEPITIPSGRDSEMVILQFRKGKAAPFIQDPMNLLTNHVVDAELVLNPQILETREKMLEYSLPEQKLQLLEDEFLKCYLGQLFENPFVDFALGSICASPNQLSMKAIADKAGFSQKHIIKIFKENVGVTPKEFLKVIRFQQAIQQIEAHKAVRWTEIALDCGFYDQSHFIADFKSFSGFTPTQYLRQKGAILNYVPIDVNEW